MDMLYFGDGVPYNYHHHHHHHHNNNNYGQVNPHCKYEFGCHEFPPSCAYAPGGLGTSPEAGTGGPPPPHNFLRTPLGPYHNPFQQMSGSYMGLFQRRPGRIKGKHYSMTVRLCPMLCCARCMESHTSQPAI